MGSPQPPQENWQGLNLKGGENEVHGNTFNFEQQGIIANDQAKIEIGKVEQTMGDRAELTHSGPGDNVARDKHVHNYFNQPPQSPKPIADGPPNSLRVYGLPRDRVVGREDDLARLHGRLQEEPRIAIAGPPGLGKSALAAAYGRKYEADYGGGIGWFDGVNLAAQLAGWLQENFGLNYDRDDRRQIADGWRAWEQFCGPQRRALVIIDGVDGAHYREQIAPYLPELKPDSSLRFLVTTRSRLDWPEQTIAPLDDAVVRGWFEQALGQDTDPAISRDRLTADPAATQALIQRLAGWPLAIKIAIATLKLDPALTIRELGRGLDGVLATPPDQATCPQGLWAMLQVSWERLDRPSQLLARLLSLLGEGDIAWDWILKMIAAAPREEPPAPPTRRKRDRLRAWLTGQPLAPIAEPPPPQDPLPDPAIARGRLRAFCLVVPGAAPETVRMHGTIRQFVGREWLPVERDRWRLVLGQVAEDWAETLPSRAPWEVVQPLRPQLPHLLAAIAHLRELASADPKHPQGQRAAKLERYGVRLALGPAAETTFRQARAQHQQARQTGKPADFVAAKEGYRRAITQFREVLAPDSAQRAGYLHQLAECLEDMGDYRAGLEAATEAVAIVDRPTTNRQTVARYLNTLGSLHHDQGNYGEADPPYRRSLEIREQVLGADHPDTAASLNNLAALYNYQGRYGEAEPLLRRSLEIKEQVLGADHPDTAASLNNLAFLYKSQGRYGEAESLYRRSLEIREQVLGADHPDTATSLNNLAKLYYSQGRYGEAEPLYRRSLEIREQVLGADHPSTATSLNNLAVLYRSQGRYGEAEPLYRRALEIREQVLGADHPDTATSLNDLAALYYSQGRYGEAEPLYRRSLEIREQVLGADHPDTATSLNDLAALYYSQGRYGEAEPLYRRSLEIREQVLGADHPDTAASLNNLALLYDSQGRYGEAEPLYRRSLEIRERVLGADHPSTALSLSNLAALYYSQGRYGEAESLYLRYLKIALEKLGEDHPNTQAFQKGFHRLVQTVIEADRAADLSDHPHTQAILQELQASPPEGD